MPKRGRPKSSSKLLANRIAYLKGESIHRPKSAATFDDDTILRFSGEGFTKRNREALVDKIKPLVLFKPDKRWHNESLDKTLGWRDFAKEAQNIELQDYQLAMGYLMLACRNSVYVLGRQIGKDYTIASFEPWECLFNANQKVPIVSESQRQSDQLKERIFINLAVSPECYASVKKSTRDQLSFINGSVIWPLPAEGAIRGFTEVTRIIANEVRGIRDEVFDAVQPMLAIKHGKLNLFSTPLGTSGKLWDYFNNPLFAKMQLPSSTNIYIPENFLADERLKLSASSFSREYEAQFSDIHNAFFSGRSIDDQIRHYDMTNIVEPSKMYYAGWDPGRTRDSSVFTIVSADANRTIRCEKIVEYLNEPFRDQLADMNFLNKRYKLALIAPEYAGLGMGPTESMEGMLMPVERFIPTSENKFLGYDYLKMCFERKAIEIPHEAQKLIHELKMFQFMVTPAGTVTLRQEKDQADDFADSLMLAVWATRMGSMMLDVPMASGRYR